MPGCECRGALFTSTEQACLDQKQKTRPIGFGSDVSSFVKAAHLRVRVTPSGPGDGTHTGSSIPVEGGEEEWAEGGEGGGDEEWHGVLDTRPNDSC